MLKKPKFSSLSSQCKCSSPDHAWATRWICFCLVPSFLYWEVQNWKQRYRYGWINAKKRWIITSFIWYHFLDTAQYHVSLHYCYSTCIYYCRQGLPGPFPQSCPHSHSPKPKLTQGIISPPVQDFAFVLVEFHKFILESFLSLSLWMAVLPFTVHHK